MMGARIFMITYIPRRGSAEEACELMILFELGENLGAWALPGEEGQTITEQTVKERRQYA